MAVLKRHCNFNGIDQTCKVNKESVMSDILCFETGRIHERSYCDFFAASFIVFSSILKSA